MLGPFLAARGIGFEAGDPKRPYVAQWLANTSVTSITFENGIQDIARTNDTTSQGTITVSQPIPLGPVLFSYSDGIGSPAVAFSIDATLDGIGAYIFRVAG